MSIRTYSDLMKIESFEDRLNYLRVSASVGVETFGGKRYLNQMLYNSSEWKKVRRMVIIRDNGFDLGHMEHPIKGQIYIHHLEPITVDDILRRNGKIFDLENLISVSFNTHNVIHYGVESKNLFPDQMERRENDTCPWKQ